MDVQVTGYSQAATRLWLLTVPCPLPHMPSGQAGQSARQPLFLPATEQLILAVIQPTTLSTTEQAVLAAKHLTPPIATEQVVKLTSGEEKLALDID